MQQYCYLVLKRKQYNRIMRMPNINEIPGKCFDRAKGFKLALRLCLDQWNSVISEEHPIKKEDLLILYPVKHITFTAIELYLRAFLLSNGLTTRQIRIAMRTEIDPHDLSELLNKCSKYEPVFNNKPFEYIHMMAGASKNYSGSRYPESGAGASEFYYKLLTELEAVVSKHLERRT